MMGKFGDRLKSLREEKNLTQKELSRIFKISESSVGMYERNEREPSFELVDRFSDYFEVTADYLLARSNSRNMTKEDEEIADRYGLNDLPNQERMFFKDWEKYTKEEIEEAREWIEFKRQQRKKNDER